MSGKSLVTQFVMSSKSLVTLFVMSGKSLVTQFVMSGKSLVGDSGKKKIYVKENFRYRYFVIVTFTGHDKLSNKTFTGHDKLSNTTGVF
jgi:hypothetical protein